MSFGNFTSYDLVEEHSDWIQVHVPAKDNQDAYICNSEYCKADVKFQNEWVVSLSESKWFVRSLLKIFYCFDHFIINQIYRKLSTIISRKAHFDYCKHKHKRFGVKKRCQHFHAYTKLEWRLNLVQFSWANSSEYAVDFMIFRKDSSNENIIKQVKYLHKFL